MSLSEDLAGLAEYVLEDLSVARFEAEATERRQDAVGVRLLHGASQLKQDSLEILCRRAAAGKNR
jgi:hypothetical protein